ncbi:hypothetical protein P280DRAFT_403083 [Massarina eburnea CBS 473.64]|uniref:A-kinase anchor protein 7-like phosphoesterase domain-containing protein n=1 Tax=Massarina eburnea CBS 473.64 TaxID=1395130 RepID=A0A6A6RVF1_9PLEO|nr:hypothetical protein P280DRAFT_403083 [Massarina eburnea CBS 473.64]
MAKKKSAGYNDFLDGEKLRDNAHVKTTLHGPTGQARDVSPPRTRQDRKGQGQGKGKGKGKPQLTHFLCLPLVTEASRPHLAEGLERLKEEIGKTGVVPLKAVRPVGTLHLTLGVMSLDEEGLERAKNYLQALKLESLLRDVTYQKIAKAAEDGAVSENLSASALPDSQAVTVDLEALVPMLTASSTSILYAEPRDATQRLVPFGDMLKKRFTEEGLMVDDKRPLRLHATIMNTIYAKPKGKAGRDRKVNHHKARQSIDHAPEGADQHDDVASTAGSVEEQLDGSDGHGPNAKSWMQFDARELTEKYKDAVWAKGVRIDRVQICKMGASKIVGEDGEVVDQKYEVVAEKVI